MPRKQLNLALIRLSALGIAMALWSTSLFALQPTAVWIETYGTAGNEYGYSVDHTSDGGYILLGTKEPLIGGNRDYYLVRTGAGGDTVWTRTYGGVRDDVGMSVRQTSDGGYIIGGFSFAPGAAVADARLVKIAANGDSVWTGEYGGAGADAALSAQQTFDGGYIFAGRTDSFGANDGDAYLVKTDAGGDTTWTRLIGGPGYEMTTSVQQTSDSGYVVAGLTNSYGAGSNDVYLIRTDASGDTVWTRTFGGMDLEVAWSVQGTSDGGYIIAGSTDSWSSDGDEIYLIKTDGLGHAVWTQTFGSADEARGRSVDQTSDGGYIVAGCTGDFVACEGIYVIRTDSSGDEIWSETYGGAYGDAAHSVKETSAGKYIIAGTATSFGAQVNDMCLIKLKESKWKAKDVKIGPAPTGRGDDETAVQLSHKVPVPFALHRSVPNPFTESTLIRFALPRRGEVSLSIHDVRGRLVTELVGETRAAGSNSVAWDGKDSFGAGVQAGIYFVHLESGGKITTGKVVAAR